MLLPFSPPAGLNSDDTVFAAGGQWADGDNVRFVNGSAQAVGADSSRFTLPVPNQICTDLFAFTRSGANTIVYGQTDLLYIGTDLNSPADRTPTGGTSIPQGWSFATWGTTLLAAARGGKLYEQSGSNAATEVVNAPDQITCILVTNERQVLACGCNEEISGTFNGLCIRGSDIEDHTDWTTSPTNNAFEHILDGPGVIIVAKQVGQYIAVWTTSALYLGTFVGDPAQTYRFDKIAENCRPISSRAVTVFNGTAWWMGVDCQLRYWAPGAPVQIVPSTVSAEFVANCDAGTQPFTYNSFTVANSAFQEIWFFYRDGRDISGNGASRYVAYSIRESALAGRPIWFRGRMARTAMLDSEVVRTAHGQMSLLGAMSDGAIMQHEALNGGMSGAYIQSAGFYLDNSQQRMLIRSCFPDFDEQSSSLSLTLYMRSRPQSPPTTKGPFTLDLSTAKKSFRASGSIAAVRISDGQEWRLGKLMFDVTPLGER